jgi:hypothetical protein
MIIKNISNLEDSLNYYNDILDCNEEVILLDFREAEYIRNNHLALLGLALENQKKDGKEIEIKEPKIIKNRKSFELSGFMQHFSNLDNNNNIYEISSIVKYTNISLDDWNSLVEFHKYFEDQLNKNIKNLSPELSNKIIQKIFELFSNVFRHSQSELGFFCAGQIYDNKFYFTIVDGGVGISTNVNKYFKKIFDDNKSIFKPFNPYKPLNGIKSILWAIQENHSTTGRGGLGLNLLQELILKSKGSLDIISNSGHYSIKDGKEEKVELKKAFNGTIISIGLNISEDTYYFLKDGE